MSDTTTYNWTVEQGERELLTVPVLSNGSPYSITGWTVDVKVKRYQGGPTRYTFPAGDIALVDDGESILLTVPAATSAAWTWMSGWWRVVITDPDSDPSDLTKYRIVEGTFTVNRD